MKKLTHMQEIEMELTKSRLTKIVNDAVEDQLQTIVETVTERAVDAFSNVWSIVENALDEAVSDARSAAETDPEEVEALKDKIILDLETTIREMGLSPDTGLQEKVRSGKITVPNAIVELLGREMNPPEARALLAYLSQAYEHEFALFMWQRMSGTGV